MSHHRVVNIVQKRNPMPQNDYDGGYDNDQWYGGPRHYQEMRDYHNEDTYFHNDRHFRSFHRNSSPPRNEHYPQQMYSRDDLRHQLSARKNGRASHFRSRGRGSGPPPRSSLFKKGKEDRDYRNLSSLVVKRDRSPLKESPAPATSHAASKTSSRDVSEEREEGQIFEETQEKSKPSVVIVINQTSSSSVEESPSTSGAPKEQPSASVAVLELEEEVEEEEEEKAAASMEPKPTPEDDFKARRSEAIRNKAVIIEKHYRQDCETFRTVVNMLVAKDPRLENLLQASLDENLEEIKQRCLKDLRSFVTELDQISEQPDNTA